ncbi:MAG: endopeptidase La, partial [Clostridia bacterium]|nr:endopeptidase La [Clostridia bacterium]
MNYLLPLVALRNIVVMPNSTVSFDVLRDFSKKAVEAAMNGSHEVILTAQKDPMVENPSFDELFETATLCRIKQVVKLPQGMVRVMVDGVERVAISEQAQTEPYFRVIAETLEEIPAENVIKNAALARNLQTQFDEYIKLTGVISREELLKRVFKITSISELCDCMTGTANLDFRIKQEILEVLDVYERAEMLSSALGYEIEILKMQKQLNKKVQQQIDRNQRDYFLREEKKIIEEELGEGVENEAAEYRQKLDSLKLSDEVREKIEKEISRFERMAGSSADSAVSRNYLDTVLDLPWEAKTEENLDVEEVKRILDEEHYGLCKVKERIVEQMAVRKLTSGRQGTLICLAGPPGTGKTSIAKSIARSCGRKYVRISLGGVRDEAEIRGHRKTYIGAMPGKIISGMLQAKVKNPLLLLDEIDKMGQDVKGDPASAMLEVLDYEQNKAFCDHYLDLPFDLSDVMFIATANDVSNIPRPLLDRLEIIQINGYTNVEKLQIAKNYLVPKQAKENGIEGRKYEITDAALSKICEEYTKEAGVRQTERAIASLMRKLALKFAEGRRSVKVTDRNLKEYLCKPKYHYEMMNGKHEVGIVRGLAWT